MIRLTTSTIGEKVSDTNGTGFEPRALAVGEENVVRMRRRPMASARGSLRQPKFEPFVSDTFSLATPNLDADKTREED